MPPMLNSWVSFKGLNKCSSKVPTTHISMGICVFLNPLAAMMTSMKIRNNVGKNQKKMMALSQG